MTTPARRQGYEGVAVAVPVTVPYVRYSTRSAHWFIGQALRRWCRHRAWPRSRSMG